MTVVAMMKREDVARIVAARKRIYEAKRRRRSFLEPDSMNIYDHYGDMIMAFEYLESELFGPSEDEVG